MLRTLEAQKLFNIDKKVVQGSIKNKRFYLMAHQKCNVNAIETSMLTFHQTKTSQRPHTTLKNARNTKSVSRAKLSTHKQQELLFLQMLERSLLLQTKSSCFMRETDFVFPGIFDVV